MPRDHAYLRFFRDPADDQDWHEAESDFRDGILDALRDAGYEVSELDRVSDWKEQTFEITQDSET